MPVAARRTRVGSEIFLILSARDRRGSPATQFPEGKPHEIHPARGKNGRKRGSSVRAVAFIHRVILRAEFHFSPQGEEDRGARLETRVDPLNERGAEQR